MVSTLKMKLKEGFVNALYRETKTVDPTKSTLRQKSIFETSFRFIVDALGCFGEH